MRIVENGMVGKVFECTCCHCKFLFESHDKTQQKPRGIMPASDVDHGVECPECRRFTVVLEERFAPAWPNPVGRGGTRYTIVNLAA